MGETSIEWTSGPNGEPGYSFNPWVGCQRVSPGCEHCYAEAYDKRVGGVPVSQRVSPDGDKEPAPQLRWGPKAPRVRTSPANWRKPLKWNREAAAAGQRRKVFCASLADVFELNDRIEPRWRLELFSLIRQTPNLTWLLLTKRPQNIETVLASCEGVAVRHADGYMGSDDDFIATRLWLRSWRAGTPPPNVWLGTTVEDQQRANERIPYLIAVPAKVRFLSCEPLLGPLNLSKWMDEDELGFVNSEIDWVIIGGESGPGARPMDLGWARSLVGQCRDGGRSVEPRPFVKQLGRKPFETANVAELARPAPAGDIEAMIERSRLHPPPAGWTRVTMAATGRSEFYRYHRFIDSAGADPLEWPEELRVREFPEVRR